MSIILRYGKNGLPLDLPPGLGVDVIRKPVMPILTDADAALRSALAAPAGCSPLIEEARGCRSACILICDITRPVPNGQILPALIGELLRAGMKAESITVVVATGLHRPNEGEELRELVGSDWVLQTVKVANHFARCEADHDDFGVLAGSVPVKLDRRFVRADLRIVVGLVEPHFMAGYSGGRKIMAPGVAHEDTIRALHSAAILEHCRATNCILEGNPLHELQLEILRRVGRCLAVNTIIDEERRLSFINFGEMEASHRAAVDFVRPYAEIPMERRYPLVVTSAAGYPLDQTYYQAVKGMVGALDILEPGGDLLVVAECSEGIGSAEFAEAQRRMIRLGPDLFLDEIGQKAAAAIDEWETEMLVRALKKGNVHLFSTGLTADQWPLTGVRPVASVAEAIVAGVKKNANRPVAIIPEGPYVIPVWRGI